MLSRGDQDMEHPVAWPSGDPGGASTSQEGSSIKGNPLCLKPDLGFKF